MTGVTEKGAAVLAVSITFTLLSCIVVGLRIYTRYRILRNTGPDDWLVLVALACAIALLITLIGQVHYGMGIHIWNISSDYLLMTMKYFYASLPPYYFSLTFTKISLLLQCFRIFTAADLGMRMASYILMGLVICIGIYTVVADVFICTPIRHFWDVDTPGTCVNEAALWLTNAAFNILTDIAIFVLPIKRVWSLQLPTNRKRLLIIVFATGFFACIASIIRLRFLVKIANSDDPTYDNSGAAVWSCIEVNVALICACLPSLKPLVAPFIKDMTSGAGKSGNRDYTSRITGSRMTRMFTTRQGDAESEIEITSPEATRTRTSNEVPFEINCRKEWSVTVETADTRTLEGSRDGSLSSAEVKV